MSCGMHNSDTTSSLNLLAIFCARDVVVGELMQTGCMQKQHTLVQSQSLCTCLQLQAGIVGL